MLDLDEMLVVERTDIIKEKKVPILSCFWNTGKTMFQVEQMSGELERDMFTNRDRMRAEKA